MYAFPSLSITTALPFTFDPFAGQKTRRITYLEVQVLAGSVDIYVGPWRGTTIEQTIDFSAASLRAGRASQDASGWVMDGDSDAAGRHHNIKPGWIVTACADATSVGKYVMQVDDKYIVFSEDMEADATGTMTIQDPYYFANTNGFLLSPGLWKEWNATNNSAFLSGPLRFSVASGTGLMNLQYDFA